MAQKYTQDEVRDMVGALAKQVDITANFSRVDGIFDGHPGYSQVKLTVPENKIKLAEGIITAALNVPKDMIKYMEDTRGEVKILVPEPPSTNTLQHRLGAYLAQIPGDIPSLTQTLNAQAAAEQVPGIASAPQQQVPLPKVIRGPGAPAPGR